MPSYTNIPKPTGAPYVSVNSSGKEGFDDAGVLFDDPGTFFDGVNNAVYVNLAKPTSPGYGDYMWSEMTFAWSDANQNWTESGYTNIPKPL